MDGIDLAGILLIGLFLLLMVIAPLTFGIWEYKREWGYKGRLLDEIKTTYTKISSLIGFTDSKSKDKPPGETGGLKGHWK